MELTEGTSTLLGSSQESAIGGKKILLSSWLAVQSLHNGFFWVGFVVLRKFQPIESIIFLLFVRDGGIYRSPLLQICLSGPY